MTDFSKYIGLKFKHQGRGFDGVDCYGLLALMLKEEKGIEMPEFEYTLYWHGEGYNHIADNVYKFKNWGPVKEASRPFDVILFYSSAFSRDVVNHMGIFIGDDKFVHVSVLYNSRIDRLNAYWSNRIYAVLRCPFV